MCSVQPVKYRTVSYIPTVGVSEHTIRAHGGNFECVELNMEAVSLHTY